MPCHDSYPVYDTAGAYAELLCEAVSSIPDKSLSPRLKKWKKLHFAVDVAASELTVAHSIVTAAKKKAKVMGLVLGRDHPTLIVEGDWYKKHSDAKRAEQVFIEQDILGGKWLYMS